MDFFFVLGSNRFSIFHRVAHVVKALLDLFTSLIDLKIKDIINLQKLEQILFDLHSGWYRLHLGSSSYFGLECIKPGLAYLPNQVRDFLVYYLLKMFLQKTSSFTSI